jgi:hypothetical protein
MGMTMRRLPADHPVLRPRARLQVLHAVVVRDTHGLGLGLTPTNVVERIKPGGAAERCGVLRLNDVVIRVDGEAIGARSAAQAIKPDSFETAFDVLRADPVGPVRVVLRPPARMQTASKLRELAGPEEDVSSTSSQQNLAMADAPPGLEEVAQRAKAPVLIVPLAAKPPLGGGAHATLFEGDADPFAEPSDTQLLDFLLGLQGFDRTSLVGMYQTSARARAAARAEAAEEHSARVRRMVGGVDGSEVVETGESHDPSEGGISEVFSCARRLLEFNLGGTGSNGATSDLGRGEAPASALAAEDAAEGQADAVDWQEVGNGEAEDGGEAEPLALRIQRLLTQSSDDLSSPGKREMTSLEKDGLAPRASSETVASVYLAGGEGARAADMSDGAIAPRAIAESSGGYHADEDEAEEPEPQGERF